MSAIQKLYKAIRNNPRNVTFADLVRLLNAAGFEVDRVTGSHHVFKNDALPAVRITIHARGKDAVAYQVREVLEVIEQHRLLEVK